MQYPVNVQGFEGRLLFVETAGLFSGAKLMLDGQPAPKGPKRGQFLLRRNDGSDAVAQLRGVVVDPIPQVVVDGTPIKVVEPLPWYVWVWSALPLSLLILGGLMGGALGAVAMAVNGHVFRTNMNGALKFAATGAISIMAAVVYLVLAIALTMAVGR